MSFRLNTLKSKEYLTSDEILLLEIGDQFTYGSGDYLWELIAPPKKLSNGDIAIAFLDCDEWKKEDNALEFRSAEDWRISPKGQSTCSKFNRIKPKTIEISGSGNRSELFKILQEQVDLGTQVVLKTN